MQLIIVIVLVSLAGFYLGRRMYLTMKGKKQAGCEKCGIDHTKLTTSSEAKP